MKYYFLVSFLPEIRRDDRKVKFGFRDFLEERNQIADSDWHEVELLLLGRDVFLLEGLLRGKARSVDHTLYGEEFWREQLKAPKEVAEPFAEFLESVAGRPFGPAETDRLYGLYYDYVLANTSSRLLREYFQFERDFRNIVAALRARRRGLPPSEHLVGEGDVVEALGKSSAEDFGLGKDFSWIERLVHAADPQVFEDLREQILWDYLEDRIEAEDFAFDVVLSYVLRLDLLERRLALSAERGMEIVRKLEEF